MQIEQNGEIRQLVEVNITGVTPLLMRCDRSSHKLFPEFHWLDELSKMRNKSTENVIELARREFMVSFYSDTPAVSQNKGKFTEPKKRKIIFPIDNCLLYTSPSPRDRQKSRMPSSA